MNTGIQQTDSSVEQESIVSEKIEQENFLTFNQPAESNDSEEFVSNTNVERFMGSNADDHSAMSGFTDFSNTALFNNTTTSGVQLPRPVTPERISSAISGVSDEATMATFATGDPGRIMPKKSLKKANKYQISEDLPFDEGIPFDERTRTRSQNKKNGGGLRMPNMLDELDDQSEASEGSANSEQVLDDLNKLSRFMADRKRSSKGGSGSGGLTSSSRRGRLGGSSVGRKSSFGNKLKYDTSRGI